VSAPSIDWDLLALHLRERIRENELSGRAAADEIGCSPATLTRLLQGAQAPNTPDTHVLLKAVSWLGKSLADFQTGAAPSTSSFADVEMHLRALPQLNDQDKEGLVAMVKALHEQYRLRQAKG
jgi:transcriptional regulator with XRE-family HTH domain